MAQKIGPLKIPGSVMIVPIKMYVYTYMYTCIIDWEYPIFRHTHDDVKDTNLVRVSSAGVQVFRGPIR